MLHVSLSEISWNPLAGSITMHRGVISWNMTWSINQSEMMGKCERWWSARIHSPNFWGRVQGTILPPIILSLLWARSRGEGTRLSLLAGAADSNSAVLCSETWHLWKNLWDTVIKCINYKTQLLNSHICSGSFPSFSYCVVLLLV